MPSGAVCYTEACLDIVVLLVTLCFRLHVTCGSLQRIVYTVVPFVTLWVYGICPVVPFVALGLMVFALRC